MRGPTSRAATDQRPDVSPGNVRDRCPVRSGLRSRETSAVRPHCGGPEGLQWLRRRRREPQREVVILWASAAFAVAVGLLLVALRVVNDGMEPEGRNWWLVAEIAIGIGFLPAGTLLLSYPRRRLLGASFVAVGLTQLIAALACEWEAYAASVDDTRWRRRDGWEVIETIGLIVLTVVVPWFLPWRTRRGPQDPLKLWLAFGVAASLVGTLCAVTALGDLPGTDVVGPLMLLVAVPFLTLGAIVGAVRDRIRQVRGASHRFLVWTVLAAGIAVTYTVVVAGFGALLGANGPAWLLVACTAGIAIALEPARRRGPRHRRPRRLRRTRRTAGGGARSHASGHGVRRCRRPAPRARRDARKHDAARLRRDRRPHESNTRVRHPGLDAATSTEFRRLASFGVPTANLESFAFENGDDADRRRDHRLA